MEIKRYNNPAKDVWSEITARPAIDITELFGVVKPIIDKVRNEGDNALKELEERFDNVTLDSLEVSDEELEGCESLILKTDGGRELMESIQVAYTNISRFHSAQQFSPIKVTTMPGIECTQKSVPIEKVGLYVPGGSAPLFSTTLMLAVPAKIAGCKELTLCTPPGKDGKINPVILYTAKLCGVNKICKLGGAQAIAAMAVGTETVKKADKIFGPGNRFVMAAKQWVSLQGVAIDMPAGPSEVEVIADDSSIAEYVAADLLSQAEHGPDSQAVLICTSKDIADSVEKELQTQLDKLPRKDVAQKSLQGSRIVVFDGTDKMEQIVELTNMYAPEHLIISTEDYMSLAEKITSAGSVFLGNYACESAGDYASGTNHTLPTMGYARSYSGLSLDSFCRKMTFQELTCEGIENIGKHVERMAVAEGLEGHANAMRVRIKRL